MEKTRLPGLSPVGMSVADWKRSIADKLYYALARFPAVATPNDRYLAVALAVRDRLVERWLATASTYAREGSRTVCYLSAEFLLGPHLANNLLNLGVEREVRQALAEMECSLDEVIAQEEEPGLGNGGLGRLAACYLDSLATLEIPAIGYGIRYEYGIFDQSIRDGWQVETTDNWLRLGNPWEIPRPEISFPVFLGGRTEATTDAEGRLRVAWLPDRVVKGVAYDTPILGYRVNTANMLRLWSAQASEAFDFQAFNEGEYYRAVEQKTSSENITKVLYPNDETARGKQLRLEQQFFFVTCALQDMLRIHLQRAHDVDSFDRKYAVQLNDTHPAVAVAELMRLLVDVHGVPWERAWETTNRTFGYTNHTLLPEALEKWPLPLFRSVLPRHLEIVYEINRRFLDEVRVCFPGDEARVGRVSLIDEAGPRYVRMANLACVGSHAVNGVARMHSDLVRRELFRDFSEMWPEKFTNVTNGVTPRRFVALINPRLSALISGAIGDGWVSDLGRLSALEPLAGDAAFRAEWRKVKLANKTALAAEIRARAGVEVVAGDALRRAGQAHPRVQAAAPQRAARGRAPRAASPRPRARRRPPHGRLRRQGRARLPDGQADHQARPLGGRGRERGPRRGRPPQGRVPARLQRHELRADLPRRRALGADLDRRQGGLRHRQHEVLAQRRAHDRHARRRQRRDPRGRRRRRTSSCSG